MQHWPRWGPYWTGGQPCWPIAWGRPPPPPSGTSITTRQWWHHESDTALASCVDKRWRASCVDKVTFWKHFAARVELKHQFVLLKKARTRDLGKEHLWKRGLTPARRRRRALPGWKWKCGTYLSGFISGTKSTIPIWKTKKFVFSKFSLPIQCSSARRHQVITTPDTENLILKRPSKSSTVLVDRSKTIFAEYFWVVAKQGHVKGWGLALLHVSWMMALTSGWQAAYLQDLNSLADLQCQTILNSPVEVVHRCGERTDYVQSVPVKTRTQYEMDPLIQGDCPHKTITSPPRPQPHN